MSSNRHSNDAFLDAARECVMAFGVRRTTFSDVARRAGVSRMTLYRAYPDVDALIAALMTREFGELIERTEAGTNGLSTARERLVEAVVTGARGMAANELFERVLEVDPELLLPYVTDRLGQTQRAAIAFAERALAAGVEDGSIPRGAEPGLAYGLLMAVQSFVLSVRVAESEGRRDESFAELHTLLDGYLASAGAG